MHSHTRLLIKGKTARGADLAKFMDWFRDGGETRISWFYKIASLVDECLEKMKDPVKGRIHFEIEL